MLTKSTFQPLMKCKATFPRFRLVLLPVTFKAKNFRFSSAEKVLIFHPKTKKLEKLWLQISQQKNLSFQT